MKKRIISALIIVAISLLLYPIMEHLADVERGYDSNVFGGEELLLILGLSISVLMIIDCSKKLFKAKKEKDDCQMTTAFSTESEQSDEHITISQLNYTTE